jgi:hypothetical protein
MRGLGTPRSRRQKSVTVVIPVSLVKIFCQHKALEPGSSALGAGRCARVEVCKLAISIDVDWMRCLVQKALKESEYICPSRACMRSAIDGLFGIEENKLRMLVRISGGMGMAVC